MVQYDRFSGAPRTEGALDVPLPVRDPEATWYRATIDDASAVFRVDTDVEPSEVRIPYVVSDAAGAFSALMDSLVDELGVTRVRFVNLPPKGHMPAIDEKIGGKSHVRDIRDAVHGFNLTQEQWDRDRYDDEPAICLVGEWRPGADADDLDRIRDLDDASEHGQSA